MNPFFHDDFHDSPPKILISSLESPCIYLIVDSRDLSVNLKICLLIRGVINQHYGTQDCKCTVHVFKAVHVNNNVFQNYTVHFCSSGSLSVPNPVFLAFLPCPYLQFPMMLIYVFKTEAACSSTTLVRIYKSTWQHILQGNASKFWLLI
jgi:hypothetical protein